MTCTNCFNGCSEVTSDKCVKYTGVSIPLLGITNGDTLLSVETNIANYLITALNGTGIVPYINPESFCSLVSDYLPGSGDITLVDIIDALINSLCDLQTQITSVSDTITTLNSDYTIGCLSGITSSSDTHDVLQASITKICELSTSLTNLNLDLSTNYVAIDDINTYIDTYITTSTDTSLVSSKMVPYVAYEYYGPLTNFDVTGAGTGDWIDVYLCNGNNGTPDKRGRTTVGAIVAVGGGTLDSVVDPSTSTNPNYALGDKTGTNAITLTSAQIPSHTHGVTDSGHTHTVSTRNGTMIGDYVLAAGGGAPNDDTLQIQNIASTNNTTSSSITGISINSTGGGSSHNNIQPTIAAYYIIYLP